jgi:release factor glutamine methyltransferase
MHLGEYSRALAVRFESSGIPHDEARLDAELLIRSALGWDRERWLADSRAPASPAAVHAVEPLAARRQAREPMAYILGQCEFWNRQFEVSPAVLIPRPETEIIVEQTLSRLHSIDGHKTPALLDVGTGSGCIAVSITAERPEVYCIATDVSADALEVARRNAVRHRVIDRIEFRQTTLLGDVGSGSLDFIVSNPPYVPSRELPSLPPEVRSFEPPDALDGGEDGLDVIRGLTAGARSALSSRGWLMFEFGFGQADAVRRILVEQDAWTGIDLVADLQGIPRTAVARRR